MNDKVGSNAEKFPDDSICVESQEYTYGIDNTGTRFSDTASYCIILSDGSKLEWDQTPTGGWTDQLTQWAQEIQAAADLAGLRWFVEPRYIDTAAGGDVTSLDGTISGPGGNPSGLPGAPSIPVAVALADGGMQYRYVNFQICPGQPVPVTASRKASELYGDEEFFLTAAGPVLGPIQKFWMCIGCGKEPVWYLEDAVTPASEGQIPDCYEPCGTLTNSEGPPAPNCQYEIDVACDNNNSTLTVDFKNTITRRAKVCNGEQIAVDYFEADPNDPAALAPYELVGDFVDCATGEPVPLPELPCDELDRLVTPECLVKRTIQVGYDNGRTPGSSTNDGGSPPNLVRFNENFTVLGWEVNGSQYGQGHRLDNFAAWTPQLEGWAEFKQLFDPNNSTAEFAFLPAPTWRHCQLTTCDPRAVYGPIKMQRDDGVIFDVFPVPSISFASYEYAYRYTKVDCNDLKTVVWCDAEGNEIDAPEDPECFVPCGFHFGPYINSAGIPDCTETVRDLCDQTDAGPIDFVLVITDCGGKRTRDRWTTASYASATDPDGLVPYNVVGQVINCDTGEPYVEPPLPCEDFVIADLFSMDTDSVTGTLRNREWDLGPRQSSNKTVAEGRAQREAFDFTAATTVDADWASLQVNDTNNDSTVEDAQVIEGYIVVDQAMKLRWSGGSLGYFAFEFGECCGPLELKVEGASGDASANPTADVLIPKGVHAIRMWNIDDYTNTSRSTQYSLDDGVTWVNDGTPPGISLSRLKPDEQCKKIKVCKPSGTFIGLIDGLEIDPADCYECSKLCTPVCCGGVDTGPGAQTVRITEQP